VESKVCFSTKDQRQMALALAFVLAEHHNGNKHGTTGFYPLRTSQGRKMENGEFVYQPDKGAYMGHNIVALLFDVATMHVVGDLFWFNHNRTLKSQHAHPETLSIQNSQKLAPVLGGGMKGGLQLSKLRLITSLEPCSMCRGMIIHNGIKDVMWLQDDPELTERSYPDGITARRCPEFNEFSARLHEAYQRYYNLMTGANEAKKVFYVDKNGKIEQGSASVPSFLCTDDAFKVYLDAAKCFRQEVLDVNAAKRTAFQQHLCEVVSKVDNTRYSSIASL